MKQALFFSFCLLTTAVFAQQREMIFGGVKDAQTSEPMHGAHVGNVTTQELTISGLDGVFSLSARLGDTLYVSFIGYKSANLILTKDHFISDSIQLLLHPDAQILQDVEVNFFPSYDDFKRQIVDTQLVSTFEIYGLDKIPGPKKEALAGGPKDLDYSGVGVGMGFDLEGLTKKGKEKKSIKRYSKGGIWKRLPIESSAGRGLPKQPV